MSGSGILKWTQNLNVKLVILNGFIINQLYELRIIHDFNYYYYYCSLDVRYFHAYAGQTFSL